MTGRLLDLTYHRITLMSIEIPVFEELLEHTKLNLSNFDTDILEFKDDWWMTKTKFPDSIYFCKPNKVVEKCNTLNDVKAVRPIIKFKNTEYFAGNKRIIYDVNDEFFVGNCLFKVLWIEKGCCTALCETAINYVPYNKQRNYVSLDKSEISSCIQLWVKTLDITSNGGGQGSLGVSKATREERIRFYVPDIKPITVSEAENTKKEFLMLKNISFWMFGRKDEFTGYYIDKTGNIKEGDITSKHNVCPCLSVLNTNSIEAYIGRFFVIENYVFRPVSINNVLCINTIGLSCYSTGIKETESSFSERVFFKDAEISGIIDEWLDYLEIRRIKREK